MFENLYQSEEYELVVGKTFKLVQNPSRKESNKIVFHETHVNHMITKHSKSIKPISYSWKHNHEKHNKVSEQV